MKVVLASPRGFCAGVDRAIEIVERALALLGPPIYVRHEIVHNRHVVEALREQGAVFVEDLDDVPDGATVVFSAHGVPLAVEEEARRRGLRVFDATCPLVTKVHDEAKKRYSEGDTVILIGHAGHPEVVGTMGRIPGGCLLVGSPAEAETVSVPDPERVAYVTQTTLSLDEAAGIVAILKSRFPALKAPSKDDICYATQNRQNAVKKLEGEVDLLFVLGAPNSSNSNRLREIGERTGIRSHLIESAENIDPQWLGGARRVGITAGASAPEHLVREVVDRLRECGIIDVREERTVIESTTFGLPRELTAASADALTLVPSPSKVRDPGSGTGGEG
ncbi:MAG: 4-hydroxy-3-methylbut-2-enyl diphosphate reductase [Nitrospirae bacterium RBG_16_64_22]|nr:MAG: 4-hydroxy-3-methylbut-2-enyl diphosphate reductase [Nitrospirae bacterium RBG_16_64_22]